MNYYKNENKIRKIGGKVEQDYRNFRSLVWSINADQIPLFLSLGFSRAKDTDIVLDAILMEGKGAQSLYIERITKGVEEGKIPLENVLARETLKKREGESEEDKRERYERGLHRALVYRFKDIEREYQETYKPSPCSPNMTPIKILRGCLTLTSNGLEIDIDKFIEIYTDYMEADGSITRKLHQEAAEALTRFFNGAVAITDEEIHRYFSFKSGIAEIKPESVNGTNYARLGKRIVETITTNEYEAEEELP